MDKFIERMQRIYIGFAEVIKEVGIDVICVDEPIFTKEECTYEIPNAMVHPDIDLSNFNHKMKEIKENNPGKTMYLYLLLPGKEYFDYINYNSEYVLDLESLKVKKDNIYMRYIMI